MRYLFRFVDPDTFHDIQCQMERRARVINSILERPGFLNTRVLLDIENYFYSVGNEQNLRLECGCPICGDLRENPDSWECLGCGSI